MEFKEGERLIIVHFGELWLRGRNRNIYIKSLARNMNKSLEGEDIILEKLYDRFLIRLGKKSNLERIRGKLKHVFGLSNYEIAYTTKSTLGSITKLSKKILSKKEKKPIRIDAHRSYKELDFNSMDIVKKVSELARKMGFEVSNKSFQQELRINVTKDISFVSEEKVRTFGGLPVGTSGKAVVLLSGGIDSPVAAWYAMKRGLEPIYVHIHGYQDSKEVLASKMPKIVEKLSPYSNGAKIYYLPSHLFQMAALKTGRYELVLIKAFMLMAAEIIAEKEGAQLIYTGESLGQVASQTASNIAAESDGIGIPILRPLIGLDKEEIIKLARTIETYEYSILPYKDVCSINSSNPRTQLPIKKMRELKKEINLAAIVKKSLQKAEVIGFNSESKYA